MTARGHILQPLQTGLIASRAFRLIFTQFMNPRRLLRTALLVAAPAVICTLTWSGSALAKETAPLLLEVSSFARTAENWVAWKQFDWDPEGETGLALPPQIEAVETSPNGAETVHQATVLTPPGGNAGRAFILIRMDGTTEPGHTRQFAIREGASGAPDNGVNVRREGNLLFVSNRWFEAVHDLERGGTITAITTKPAGTELAVSMGDGFHRFSVAADPDPGVEVFGGDDSLGAIIEVRAHFTGRNRDPKAEPEVHYRYRYDAESPLIHLEAVIPEQNTERTFTQLRLFDFNIQRERQFEESWQLITGGNGDLIPNKFGWSPCEARPLAGVLMTDSEEALAIINPISGGYREDLEGAHVPSVVFIQEWNGSRVELSGALCIAPADGVEDYVALAEGPVVRAILPDLSEKIEAGLAEANRGTGAGASLARALFTAARQRMEWLVEPRRAGHLAEEAARILGESTGESSRPGVAVFESEHFLALANEALALLFKKTGSLVSLDGIYRGEHGYIKPADFPRAMWAANFRVAEDRKRIGVTSNQSQEATHEIEALEGGGQRLVLTWPELEVNSSKASARVTIEVHPENPLSSWSIALGPEEATIGLESLDFPIVSGVYPDFAGETPDFVLLPWKSGSRIPNPRMSALGASEYGGMFHAYWQGSEGLYLGAHDPELAIKFLKTLPGGTAGQELIFTHTIENSSLPGTGFEMDFSMELGVFEGNWFDATQIFRDWFTRQDFTPEPLHANTGIPEWIKQAVASGRDLPREIFQRLGSPPEFVHWWYHWSGEAQEQAWDDGHPSGEYVGTPDIPRTPVFLTGVLDLQNLGVRVLGYTLASWWDYSAESWEEDGAGPGIAEINGPGRPFLHRRRGMGVMCQATELYREKMQRVMTDLVEDAPVDGTYFDLGGGARDPLYCYAGHHGHPVGGGSFQVEGKRELLQAMREAARESQPDFIMVTEGTAGLFLTAKDGYAFFQQNTPMIQALYGDYVRPAGNKRIQTADGHNNQVDGHHLEALNPAKTFAWGGMIGRMRAMALLTSGFPGTNRELRQEPLDYYKNLIWHKYVARPWLNLGTMLRPPRLTQITPEAPPEFFADTMLPSGAWKAPDGSVAFVFANGWYSKPSSFHCKLDPAEYGIESDGSMALYRLTPAGDPPEVEPHYEKIEDIRGEIKLQETLKPGGVLVLVAKPTA